jgi:hypothetical protein
MKYIIEDKQLFNAIYKFIDNDLVEDGISWEYEEAYDDDDGTNENIIEFIGNKYSSDVIDEKYFTYIRREYYEYVMKSEPEFARDWIDIAPLLDLNPCRWWCDKLNGYFGEYWKPVFEQWFSDKFPDFDVKSFMYPP